MDTDNLAPILMALVATFFIVTLGSLLAMWTYLAFPYSVGMWIFGAIVYYWCWKVISRH